MPVKNDFFKTILFAFIFLLFSQIKINAQDAQLSQFYAAPIYLNPAMAGTTFDGRATVNYRNQWVGLPTNYRTSLAAFDIYTPDEKLSYAVQFKNDEIGDPSFSNISEFSLDFVGAYLLKIKKGVNLNFGVQLGFTQTSLSFRDFIFGDQITNEGITGTTQEQLNRGNEFVPKIGAGALLLTKLFWLGTSLHHINQPDISLLGGYKPFPMKFSLMGGYAIPLKYHRHFGYGNMNKTVSPVFLFTQQGKASQLSLGAYLTYSPILFGVWYRGIPLFKLNDKNVVNQDAVILMTGFKVGRFKIGWSTDITLSDLPQNQALSHEISLTYNFNFYKNYARKSKRRAKALPCPIPWNLL